MHHLEEILPFLILIAISVGGKLLEGMRKKAQPPSEPHPQPSPQSQDEEDDWKHSMAEKPSEPHPSPLAPPVAEM
ncbi:MAG TPA: hypothetical protein VLM37_02405, partial [Fibrobacteraceae bacterium]|nr:hypothetical protein [Fibrobacteraceae bacterium]